MQRVNIACEHRAELACHRVDAGVYRGSSHRVFKRKRAGDAKRPQPREASGKIAEALAEENAWSDEVRGIGTDPLSARVADPPGQSTRHERLMQVVAINLALDREIRCVESRTPGAAPVAVNPSAIDTDSECRSKETKNRPSKPFIDDIAPFIRLLGAREERQYGFVSNGRIIKWKRAWKKPVARNAMPVGGSRRDPDRRANDQPTASYHSRARSKRTRERRPTHPR